MNELQTQNNAVAYITMIERAAIDPNVDIEKMERLLQMQERIMDKQSEIEFNSAMVTCQAEMPVIIKDKKNNQTNSTYAQLESIIEAIAPVYTKNGFSLSFDTREDEPDKMTILCNVSHKAGHSKQYQYKLPIDDVGIQGKVNKTGVHGRGSTASYGRRYLTLMIFNLAVAGEDIDGNQPSGKKNIDAAFASGVQIGKELVRLADSIQAIRDGIKDNNLSSAAEAYFELTNDEKSTIWTSQTKGGPFSQSEKEIIRSEEFRQGYYNHG